VYTTQCCNLTEINTLMFCEKKHQIVWQLPMVRWNLMAASSGCNTQKTVRRLHQNNHTYQSDNTGTSKNTVILEDLLHT
jgi:5-methylcytosine-specific restriction endonuclease McrA